MNARVHSRTAQAQKAQKAQRAQSDAESFKREIVFPLRLCVLRASAVRELSFGSRDPPPAEARLIQPGGASRADRGKRRSRSGS